MRSDSPGSGLVTPETRTRIGEMPEIGRPMVQRMMPEQAGQAQFAALDLSRRAKEIGRLRDLAPPALVSEQATADRDAEPVQEPAKEPAPEPVAAEHPDEPAAPVVVAAVAPMPPAAPPPVAPPAAPQADDSGKAPADTPPADSRHTEAGAIGAIEPVIPGVPGADATASRAVSAPADAVEVVPSVHLRARPNLRLPRGRARAKAASLARRPARHAIRRAHRHLYRSYAYYGSPANPFGRPRMQSWMQYR
jgi:hypothetical protein